MSLPTDDSFHKVPTTAIKVDIQTSQGKNFTNVTLHLPTNLSRLSDYINGNYSQFIPVTGSNFPGRTFFINRNHIIYFTEISNEL